MSDDMEQIEARLAAYIDGALPPMQRAEIEAYLKANPTHARLIAELQSIKTAVASLPKDKAPAEVLDTLQSHLERHTLLEETETEPVLSLNRWPQLGAVAAVLLLTAGLGLLVYQVLPKQKGPPSDLALLSSPATETDGAGGEIHGPGEVTLRDTDKTTMADRSIAAKSDMARSAAEAPKRDDVAANAMSSNSGQAIPGEQFGTAQSNLQSQQGAITFNRGVPAAPVTGGFGGGGGGGGMGSASGALKTLSAATAPMATPFDGPARMVIVESDDPVITQNLLIGSLTQSGTPFEVGAVAEDQKSLLADKQTEKDSEAAKLAFQGGAAVSRRMVAGDVVGERLSGVRPVIVRSRSVQQADALVASLNTQRPIRQVARWADEHDATEGRAHARELEQMVAHGANDRAATSAPAAGVPAAAVPPPGMVPPTQPTTEPLDNIDATLPPTTQRDLGIIEPTTKPAEANADVVVYVVPIPAPAPAAASIAPATMPSTSPSTQPTPTEDAP